jgi:isopenicillin-N N-acyltransferase-like protein
MSDTIPLVECAGSEREIGRQYGEQAADAIRANLERTKLASRLETAGPVLKAARRAYTRFVPELLERTEGMAEGSGVAEDLLLLLNHPGTFGEFWLEECTPMAVANSDRGPLLGKNNDGIPGVDQDFVALRARPDTGIPCLNIVKAGLVTGQDGMNAEGLAAGHASVGSRFDKSGPRIGLRAWAARCFATCRTTRAYIESMYGASLTGKGNNIVLCDAEGTTAVLEAAVPALGTRNLGDPFVFATNHYVTPAFFPMDMRPDGEKDISIYRYGVLDWVRQTDPPATVEALQALLRDDSPWAPCRHAPPHRAVTRWSIVSVIAERRLLLAPGLPSETEYLSLDVESGSL